MEHYDLILIGSSFASSFFLAAYLPTAPAAARVLVLERGPNRPHSWQLQNGRTSDVNIDDTYVRQSDPAVKTWNFTIAHGGASNCWWAVTPRLLPNDFRMQSVYGVGRDWPISYDDLVPHYETAERLMAVSGPDETPFPRTGPYPQPAHRLSDADKMLQAAFPGRYFAQPTARARQKTDHRPACCATGTCTICPVNAKFTILNEMAGLYADPRVTLLTGATAEAIETTGGVASGVVYRRDGATETARGDLIGLGANALFNPHLLLRPGPRLTPLLARDLPPLHGREAALARLADAVLRRSPRPPLLVGPHGSGRTLIASHLARILGSPVFLLGAATYVDEDGLRARPASLARSACCRWRPAAGD